MSEKCRSNKCDHDDVDADAVDADAVDDDDFSVDDDAVDDDDDMCMLTSHRVASVRVRVYACARACVCVRVHMCAFAPAPSAAFGRPRLHLISMDIRFVWRPPVADVGVCTCRLYIRLLQSQVCFCNV